MLTIRVPAGGSLSNESNSAPAPDHFPLLPSSAFVPSVRPMRPVPTIPDGVADCFPLLPPIPYPPAAVNRLYWPGFGASRYAFAHLLLDQHTLERLKKRLAGSNKVELWYTDGDKETTPPEEPRKFVMYLLEAVPLADTALTPPDPDKPVSGEQDAYLVTFVDRRYYWQYSAGVDMVQCDTWEALFGHFTAALGVTINTLTAVDAAYGRPGFIWTRDRTAGLPTVQLFDAALGLVNYRLVVDPATEDVSLFAATAGGDDTLVSWHESQEEDKRNAAGGKVDLAAQNLGMPGSISLFSLATDTTFSGTVEPTGAGGGTVIVDADTAEQSYTDRFAKDWGKLQQAPVDAVYFGFVYPPVETMPFVGSLELTHLADTGLTLLRRPPANYPQLVRSPLAECVPPSDNPCGQSGNANPPATSPPPPTAVQCGTPPPPPPQVPPPPCPDGGCCSVCPSTNLCANCGTEDCSVCTTLLIGHFNTYSVGAGQECTIDPSTIVVSIDWGDGTTTDVPAGGTLSNETDSNSCCPVPDFIGQTVALPQHTYANDGTYTIRAVWTGVAAGYLPTGMCSGGDSINVSVYCGKPVDTTPPDGTFDTTGMVVVDGGDLCLYHGTFSVTRTTPTGGVDPINWVIDWGDGSAGDTGTTSGGVPFMAGHIYTVNGEYIVSWSATDANGNISTGNGKFTVVGCAPALTFFTDWHYSGCSVCITYHAEGGTAPYTVVIDWGFGGPTASYGLGSGQTLRVCHNYGGIFTGSYTVSFHVTDSAGGSTTTSNVINVDCSDGGGVSGSSGAGGFGGSGGGITGTVGSGGIGGIGTIS